MKNKTSITDKSKALHIADVIGSAVFTKFKIIQYYGT